MRHFLQIMIAGLLTVAFATAHSAHICEDEKISASQVTTQSDVKLFVECAAAFYAEFGPEETRRAFNEDARWKYGPTYVFIIEVATSGVVARRFVFPRNPAVEGLPRGANLIDFGTDLYAEVYRVMNMVDKGWFYYSTLNPQTGNSEFKVSYMIEIDWKGERAVIGAGLYSRDLPATCHAEDVNAAIVSAGMDAERLQEFVRCAAFMVESRGYFAKHELEADPRWSDSGTDVFVLDMMGNQVISGNGIRINGVAPHEWGSEAGAIQFGGRNLVEVGETFGEAFVYYRSYHPETWAYQPKVGFVKRVVAQGIPLLVGAGYFPNPDETVPSSACADHFVTAGAVRDQSSVQAFVRCAAEYVAEHGQEEARRAFHEDERWRIGPTYVFVDENADSGLDATSHVFPPDPSREGSVWGSAIDGFGNDYYFEVHRILSMADSGWVYYAFNNPSTGLWEPKSSYVMEIDWNGERAVIGAGIYALDIPGTCNPSDVNAALLEQHKTEAELRRFVNCAAYQVQSSGYFAGPVLTTAPRWNEGSIYVVGINANTGEIEFSGDPGSYVVSGRIPEALFNGRDMVAATAAFGSAAWYYNFTNPTSGMVEPKIAFTKLVWAQGVPLVVGSGISGDPH